MSDLTELFGLEWAEGADVSAPVDVSAVMCDKCHGRGNFIGRNGRVLGRCFTCDGSGLARSAGVVLAADDCVKCTGTGQWRAGRPCFACHGTGKTVEAAAADVSAIATAFASANSNGIKRPKLRLGTYVFSRAPDTGRNAGSIYVTQSGEYLGRVTAGQFHRALACDAATGTDIIGIALSPHAAAKAYGQKTGECACCGRELTNAESIELGIGPICRDRFGWA